MGTRDAHVDILSAGDAGRSCLPLRRTEPIGARPAAIRSSRWIWRPVRTLGRNQESEGRTKCASPGQPPRELAWSGTRGAGREGRLNAELIARLFLFARNRSDGHRDSQGLILGVDRRRRNDRLPKFRGNSASPFAARDEVSIGNDDPRQSVIHRCTSSPRKELCSPAAGPPTR